MDKIVLGIFAHPDDAEIECSGLLTLLRNEGWEVHIATMTAGDKGSVEYTREGISQIRKEEGRKAAEVIGATYHCLEFEDVYIVYDRKSINTTTALLRNIKPSIVITHSPNDYMIDHEMTCKIVQTACFSAGIKNMEVDLLPYEPVPYLFYSDPMEGKDILGKAVIPAMYADVSSVIDTKAKMLACHASQRNWLLAHHKIDEYILAMKRFGQQRGQEAGIEYAEGYRQHLGHSFPQENVLKTVLNKLIIIKQVH